jgi:hypothetical protein
MRRIFGCYVGRMSRIFGTFVYVVRDILGEDCCAECQCRAKQQ